MRITDSVLERYFKIAKIISKLSKEKDGIREKILEFGSCSTTNYVATVKETERQSLGSVATISEALGGIGVDEMISQGIMKVSQVQTVSVERRSKAA